MGYALPMRGSRVALIWAWLVPAAAAAGELELGLFAGRALPTYEQTFAYNASGFHLPVLPLPGVSITEEGSFGLTAKGGLAVGGSLTFFASDAVGIEARVDTVDIRVEATGVHFTATVTAAIPSLPSFTASVDLPPGQVDVDRLTPISIGLRLRTPGRVRLVLSAGGSYLPKVGATATQSLGVALTRYTPPFDVSRASIRAGARPGDGRGRWGGTAGLGLQVPLGGSVSLQAEARAFLFQEETLGWELVEPATGPLSELLRNGVARIDPVEFKPTFYQVTAGLAVRF
jgi:hypothetical protein